MDKLTLSGIKISTLIGTYPWEQQTPQNLHLDLSFSTDAQKIAKNDNLEDALNYEEILAHILQFGQNTHVQLIETFAERLAQSLQQAFSLHWLQITLHKPGALKDAKNVTITIERSAP